MLVRTTRKPHWGRIAFLAAVGLLAAWLAWAGRAIWFPLGIAFVIAMVLDPTVDRLENRGCPRGLATFLVFLLFLVSSALAILVLSPGISEQAGAIAGDLSRLFPDPERPDLVPVTQKTLDRLQMHPALRDALLGAAQEGTQRLSRTLEGASELALAWAPNLAWFLVVPVVAFYALMDFHRIYAKSILLVPQRHREFAQELIADISAVFGKYLRGLALLCVLLAICASALLYVLGHKYWQLLGMMVGLLYAVPVVGALFTISLAVLVTLAIGTPAKAAIVGISLLVLVNGLFDQVVTPRVLGKQVGLHPILTIIALLLGFQIGGIVGMLVAVPLAASVQRVVIHLIPKLGTELQLRPLEELKETEAETRREHLEAEREMQDDHTLLQAVVENVE